MIKKQIRLVVLTGSETRHLYLIDQFLREPDIIVEAVYAEDSSKSLRSRVRETDKYLKLHEAGRSKCEEDFFGDLLYVLEGKKINKIKKGDINNNNYVNEIIAIDPDLIICYGSSIIDSRLLTIFKGRFLNVHLGLSPYYRGSGTNIWPFINSEPEFVGVTFMQIDSGIDTGAIIHQVQADFFLGDGVHTVGTRLIKKMTAIYIKLVKSRTYEASRTLIVNREERLYRRADFTEEMCQKLYDNLSAGLIDSYVINGQCPVKMITRSDLLK